MANRLMIIAEFSGLLATLWMVCMHATPRKGVLHVMERMCSGMVLCYLCALALGLFGLRGPQGPVSALCAGYLGLPGAALSAAMALWP